MISQLSIEQIDENLLNLGARFYEEAKLPGKFIPEVFTNTWTTLIRMTMGAIWVCQVDGAPVGALGGVIHPDANDGALVAQEMFWFMDAEYRSGFNAMRLYQAFEDWAIARGSARLVMGCVLGEYAAPLRKFYMKKGFMPVDVSYFKTL